MNFLKTFYIRLTGYSYTNLGRLFLRLFVGILLIQFGVRQIATFDTIRHTFPTALGLGSEATLILMICIETICSVFIMFGFLTRIMTLPPFIAMAIAEYHLLQDTVVSAPYMLSWQQQGFLPVMFLGIYFFLLLVGPGKISIDYFMSLHLIHSEDRSEDEELEEV